MWDLIVSVPDQCLSFYFSNINLPAAHYDTNQVDRVRNIEVCDTHVC